MANVGVGTRRQRRIAQGDIFREVAFIEYAIERRGIIEVSKIIFPLVVVLTQDCDLEHDAPYRDKEAPRPANQDKQLLSVLVAPLYNAEHVYEGQHLADLQLAMTPINKTKTPGKSLRQNETPRYHFLDFPTGVPIVASIIDFKHYFSVNVGYLQRIRARHFVCRLSPLYREDLSQRFAGYLARIGLPEIQTPRVVPAAAAAAVAPDQPQQH